MAGKPAYADGLTSCFLAAAARILAVNLFRGQWLIRKYFI